MITENLSTLKIYKLTQEQYERKLDNNEIEPNALYFTDDEDADMSIYATIEQLGDKADKVHSHTVANVTDLQIILDSINSDIDGCITNLSVSGQTITYTKNDGSTGTVTMQYETKADADAKLEEAKSYADGIKNDLLNGAGGAYDTLKELGDLIDENTDAINALEIVAIGKADATHSHDDLYYTKDVIEQTKSEIEESVNNSISEFTESVEQYMETSLRAHKMYTDTTFETAKEYADTGDVETLEESKIYTDAALESSKTYTDNAVEQKAQIQIITWGADD